MGASANPDAEPEPLAEHHDISQFRSGVPGLDAWLQGKARLNEAKGGARTYVACDGTRVVGFCSLAASAVERRRVPSRAGRNMPEPVPVILLGQLAVDTDCQGRGLGSDLLVDAAKRALSAAEFIKELPLGLLSAMARQLGPHKRRLSVNSRGDQHAIHLSRATAAPTPPASSSSRSAICRSA